MIICQERARYSHFTDAAIDGDAVTGDAVTGEVK